MENADAIAGAAPAPGGRATDPVPDLPRLTVQQVARLIDMSPVFVYRLCATQQIRHQRRGRAIRFRREWVEEYLKAAIVEAGSVSPKPARRNW